MQAINHQMKKSVKAIYFATTREELERVKAEIGARLKLLEEQLVAQKVGQSKTNKPKRGNLICRSFLFCINYGLGKEISFINSH
ncbi:hypothetical protein JFU18_28500 [Bacillus sp. TH22]|uniref:Uncharacterized protein n=1 Tax=Bacillus cereus HuA2-1 TaxID=1053201 RepID=J9BRG8_BACCE|nr:MULTISPECIES: hypothetical protein [Bacillus]EJV76535.1 hypothetical protein IG3_05223 [Bacillus cereus HuA2-1]EOO12674.1 hypothetical protein IG9_05405 [Bacillus cereus HuA2-9]MBK5452388.1 hypothetical protein [Bacillus sp. TH22]MBK5457696.1 hypothetical protein [Bacillus sp. TH23]